MNNAKIIEPVIITIEKPILVIGLTMRTGIKSVFKDVTKILKQYMDCKERYGIPEQKLPWEYISLSRNFNDDQTWDYLTGHAVNGIGKVPEVFTAFEVPSGKYAVFSIRPRLKFLLGFTIMNTKRYIYNAWLPGSGYEFAGHEFEYNDEAMFNENPHYVDLYLAVKEKDIE